jgi:hypothetical protein
MATIIKNRESKLTTIGKERSALEAQMLSRESLTWLKEKIATLRSINTIPSTIAKEQFRNTTRFQLGRLYCFFYDPKGKEELPYYDKFPMVLALEKYPDGFLGLNLHYLPFKYRVAFLNKLLQFAVLNDDNDIRKLRVTYDILSASKRFKEFRPCIKRYLHNHIRSKILTIEPHEWEVASLMPLQQFKGAKPQEVWQESVEEIRKS